MEDIRKIIKKIIGEKGTIREIAGDLSMDHSNLLRLLREDANPGLKTVEKILDYLGYQIKLVRKKTRNKAKRKG